jgi:quercetin dioxygenase-like cupin family protein
MDIARGRPAGAPSGQRPATFTGEVWADPVLEPTADGVRATTVFFPPGARTHWHFHEGGQLLRVTSGTGLVCSAGAPPVSIGIGDVVWVPPGERHWHGGGATTCLAHLAVSFGETTWLDPVTDDEYAEQPS